jgi:hypothetical protein
MVYDEISGFDTTQKTMGVGMIMLGIFCIALAIVGILYRNQCSGAMTLLIYFIFAGIFAFILFIIGCVLGGFAGDTMFNEIKDNVCNFKKPNTQVTANTTITGQYNRAVNAMMCTSFCPCDAGENDKTQELWNSEPYQLVGEESDLAGERGQPLKKFGRAKTGSKNEPGTNG